MRRSEQKGFSLIEASIGITLMIALSFGAYALLTNFRKSEVDQQKRAELAGARVEVEKFLSSNEHFERMIKNAANGTSPNRNSLRCIVQNTDCRASGGGPLVLMYSYETNQPVNVVANPTDPQQGLTADGAPCNEFDRVNGNLRCPYRYEVSWRPLCPSDNSKPCLKPAMELRADLVYSPPKQDRQINSKIPVVNLERYRVRYVRSETSDDPQTVCFSVGGVWLNDQCQRQKVVCDDYEYVVGFEENGDVICSSIDNFYCPAGMVLNKINNDGTFDCVAGCANQSGGYSGNFFKKKKKKK